MKKLVDMVNVKTVIGLAAVSLLLFMSFNWLILRRTDYLLLTEDKVRMIAYVVFGGVFLLLSLFLCHACGKIRLDKVFLVLYFTLGVIYIGVTPLSSTPDETEHMLRAYGISIGDLVPEQNENMEGGSYVPSNLLYCWNRGGATLKDMKEHLFMYSNEEKEFVTYSNTALYSPLTYLPQAVGIFVTRLIVNRPFLMAYAGRFAELVTVGILLSIAIRIAPVGKQIIFALSLLPINMYECASLSGGGLTYAMIVLIVSYCLYLRYTHIGMMSVREKIYLHIMLLFVASCKIVYVPFVLMAFVIPRAKFGNRKNYITNICIAVVIVLLASVGWLSISSRYLIEYNSGVSSPDQVKFILLHPFAYLQVIANTLSSEGDWIVRTFFAEFLGYFDVQGNIVMIVMSAANIIYVCVEDKITVKLDMLTKIFTWVSVGLSLICIFSSLYVQWNPVGNNVITGLQGRYFLPLVYPIVILIKKFVNCRNKDDMEVAPYFGGANEICGSKIIVCFVNVMTIATLFVHYI